MAGVNDRVVTTLGLALLTLWGACSGCANSQHLARSLKLTAVDVRADVARKDVREASTRRPSSAEPRSARTVEASPTNNKPVSPASPSARDQLHAGRSQSRSGDRAVKIVPRRSSPSSLPREENLEEEPDDDEYDIVADEGDDLDILLVKYRRQQAESPRRVRFQVPAELPGSEAPALNVPSFDPQQPMDERKQLIEKLYASLPALPADRLDDVTQPAWTLPELETVAWENHPGLMQAAALIEVSRGAMIQAGLHPNPTVGWEQDTIAKGIQGYQGPYWSQQIVTGGKLKLARCAEAMEYENARVAYQRTKIAIATEVRGGYYELMVAQQRRRMLLALARFTDEIYRGQVELVAGGQAAPYEPLQLRVLAVQARNAVVAADNSLVAAGRRLGAATGMPDVEQFNLAAEAELTPVTINYHSAKAHLLENHTELQTVRNRIVQAQYRSRLEYIKPRVPDLSYYQTVQHAQEVGPFVNSYNLQIGVPLPIFDRNQGNILATQSSIISNEREFAAVQNDLTRRLAMALADYETSRAQTENYRLHILPDQVRTYRSVYSRYREAGPGGEDNINFGDVIVAQQTLGQSVTEYAKVLGQQWEAYITVADLLQIEDLRMLDAWFRP